MKYQDKNLKYIDAEAYDKRAESSVLEKYVLDLWQPFLKNKIRNLSVGKNIADLGCGTCEYIKEAKEAKKIYAIDISELMLKICREKLKDFSQAKIINSSISDIDLPTVDLVITIGVWEYIDPNILFNKIKEITHRGSKVVVVFPNIYNDLNWMRGLVKIKMVALRPGFVRKIFKKDFNIIETVSFGAVCWVPKKLQFLILPLWKFCDFIWRPFQKFLPLGINVYYLFERK
jgi:SAM-dependent methyltransferase